MPQIASPEIAKATVPVVFRPKRWSLPMPCAVLAAIVVLGLGVAFRSTELNRVPGLNADEAWSGVQAVRFLHGESVAWRTPTGNPLNVFFWFPLVALHAYFPPSIALLRSVSLASGLIALALNYWLCRRAFDLLTAQVSTVLLASIPIAIAYSRFAWDASQTPLASILVVYTSATVAQRPKMRIRDWAALGGSMLLAVWIHPTNVFLLPIAACSTIRIPHSLPIGRRLWLVLAVLVAFFVAATRGLGEVVPYFVDLGRLLSGTTTFQFLSGGASVNAIHWFDLITWAFLVWALFGFYLQLRTNRLAADVRLAWGLSLSLLAFFLVAGHRGVAPHFERYSVWCVVPILLVASRGTDYWIRLNGTSRRFASSAIFAVAATWLVSFSVYYFVEIDRSGGNSHLAFRTSDIDPKQSALQRIVEQSTPGKPIVIISENWWTRLPLEYLTSNMSQVHVVDDRRIDLASDAQFYFVELVGSPNEATAIDYLRVHDLPVHSFTEFDQSGRSIVRVFQVINEKVLNQAH